MPTKAIIVDLFPYTKHCELVLCFERWDKVDKTEDEKEEVPEAVNDTST